MIRYLRYEDATGKTKYVDILDLERFPAMMNDIPAPRTYIKSVISQRNDTELHVTDLLNSARYNLLNKRVETIVDIDDAAWRILGTASHLALEQQGGNMSEVSVSHDFGIGRLVGKIDLIEEIDGGHRIIDYKVVGSYSVLGVFGMYQETEVELDENGKPILYKSGEKKGMERTRKVWRTDPGKRDIRKYARQLNIYAYLAKRCLGIEAKQLYNFFVIRDGKTEIARSRGIMRSTYMVEMPLAQGKGDETADDRIESFIKTKMAENMVAIADAPICSDEECWEGRRCNDFCPVALECSKLGDNKWIGQARLDELIQERKDAECSSQLIGLK
jgi:hypothetical protein